MIRLNYVILRPAIVYGPGDILGISMNIPFFCHCLNNIQRGGRGEGGKKNEDAETKQNIKGVKINNEQNEKEKRRKKEKKILNNKLPHSTKAPRIIIGAVYKHLKEEMKFLWSKDLKINTVHVNDVCRALPLVAEKGKNGEIYNLADQNETCESFYLISTKQRKRNNLSASFLSPRDCCLTPS